MVDTQKFSEEARKILDDLGSVTEGTVSAIISSMATLVPQDIDNIISSLIPRIETGKLKFFIIKEIFVKFSAYQGKIMEAIGKTKNKIALPDIVQLRAMHASAPTIVKPVLDGLKGGMLDIKLYDMIFGQDKAKRG